MPGMDGWQFASEVNADKSINSTKMVLLSPTGKSGDEAKMKLLQWYDDYLSKPLKRGELYDSIRKIMKSDFDLETVEDEEVEEVEIIDEVEPAPAASGLVLIAEDHEVNQQLFKTILENMGHTVRIANNGVEAVTAAEQENFSLIFMDVQMPEMNGYEATEKIREKGITTPIIAATASAVKGEQDHCFAVGMNDILIKPFKKKDIIPLLDKWMVPDAQEPSSDEENAEDVETVESEELDVFDFDEAVSNFMGKKEVVVKVLHSFIEKVDTQLPAISKALQDQDFETAHGKAHAIKGGAWNLEIKKVGDKARVLEDSSRDELLEESLNALEELKEAYNEFREVVSPYLKG
jgi:CheY-like chemotaxis protein/HPt (histidine-containing phosphotransfer) domain-containing protein